jgi:hypothetical protein
MLNDFGRRDGFCPGLLTGTYGTAGGELPPGTLRAEDERQQTPRLLVLGYLVEVVRTEMVLAGPSPSRPTDRRSAVVYPLVADAVRHGGLG